ncbi:hypothetical protein E2562_008375 [Oryza meyeriana var. granulata]|uniref:ABC transporter G family member 5 n=1 Tax=Oryza meyeriana var. granulata TaxID=110450 RepID=A0A6G1EH39_9ORYZ|nr:hypothetical protein E2562_008375 [Oryza meyeriana var. granulata]
MAISGDCVVVDIEAGDGEAASTPVPYVLTFTDLSYSVRKRGGGLFCLPARPSNRLASADAPPAGSIKALLDGISGEARDGELLAVMGASGSGKSTLLDALAGRIARESLRGRVELNGEPLHGRRLRAISAYVMQDDLLYPMLTVRETLLFAAEFRLPRALSPDKKRARVDALIDQLGLARAADTIIGDEGHRGVSGGERRRVSIGTDIIHDPILLFLDEPTSGLDSASAFMVVQVLRRIAQSGSVVVMTIHQPSARILNILDRLLFLSRGRTVYAGTPSGLKPFFSEFGEPIPDNENPAEFALDTIRELEYQLDGAAMLVQFNSMWQEGSHGTVPAAGKDSKLICTMPLELAIAESVSRGKLVAGSGSGTASLSSSMPTYANTLSVEVWVLMKRAFTNTRRMPELFVMRLGTIMVTGFIFATIFWRLDDTPKGVQERLGFFAMAMSTMFYVCADALPVFVQERHIYLRETAHNAYRRLSYVLANAVVAFPPLVFLSLAFAVTTFFAVGLAGGGGSFAFFVLIILASFWAGSGFVTFLSAVVPHVMLGYTVVVAILAYFLLFSGFFINRDRIPDYWIWFHYASLVKYPYQAVMQNEFRDATRCFARGVDMFDGTPIGRLPEVIKTSVLNAIGRTLNTELTTETCVVTGADVLAQQAVMDIGKWECLLVTVAFGFLFRFLFYIVLLLGSKNKRK